MSGLKPRNFYFFNFYLLVLEKWKGWREREREKEKHRLVVPPIHRFIG